MTLPLLLHVPDGWAVVLSSLTWFGVSLLVGWWASRWSLGRLATPGPLTTLRGWEESGAWWQRHLAVRRWKDRVPEAGAFFAGGYAKRRIPSRTTADLDRFRRETLRAERVHWSILASTPLHLLWCGPALAAWMVAFGVAFNAPFIVIQRTNRGRLDTLLARRARRSGAGVAGGTGPADARRSGSWSRGDVPPGTAVTDRVGPAGP